MGFAMFNKLFSKSADKAASQWQPKDFSALRALQKRYDIRRVSTAMSPGETMPGPNYLWVGQSAIEVIMAAIAASQAKEIRHVLDLPCGHGRVLRHLAQAFPQATIDASDVDEEGVQFCAKAFGARPLVSRADLTMMSFPAEYDLIWIGSLFTHLPYGITRRWLTHLSGQLSPTGIIVATFHGRWTTRVQKISPHISDEAKWAGIMEDFIGKGYGFRSYETEEGHSFGEGSYGVSVSKPHAIVKMIEGIPDVRIFMYQEQGWGDNLDVVAFGKPKWDRSTW